jgi:hypothetical protein
VYYIKIPLRHLCEPHELQVPKANQTELWANRVKGLLQDLREGVISMWAVDTNDLRQVELQNDTEKQES